MVVVNDSTPLCNYGLYLSTILTSTDYYGEVIYLPHRNRTVITTYSTYIHHTIHATESCKETKRPPSSATTSKRLNRLRLKRQVSVLSTRLRYRLIGPGHLYRATRPSRRWHSDSNVRVSSLQLEQTLIRRGRSPRTVFQYDI